MLEKLSFGKKSLFGNNITPSCTYCRYAAKNQNGTIYCHNGTMPEEGVCKKYQYDPLKREPMTAPNLPVYSPEDFKL